MQDHKKIDVWWKAHDLSTDIQRLLAQHPRLPVPGLRSQVLRAAASIPTNIVEGCGTDSPAEFARYLDISLKSAKELEYHLVRLRDLGVIDRLQYRQLDDRLTEVRKMLYAFTKAVRRKLEDEEEDEQHDESQDEQRTEGDGSKSEP
jgi:four helix bundle protein